ncbi:MAG: cyanophycinase [Gammaproteobacteria bacterium]|nr:cyanophycinase [Gammaproteobacteria bacterium]
MPRLLCTAIVAAVTSITCALPAQAAVTRKTYIRVGNAADAAATATAGTVLMGGSTDVDVAFEWLCHRAQGGDFLVVRATGTDAYNPYVQGLCPGLNSVATLIIGSARAAVDPEVRAIIERAEIVWIAGGDQSNYINDWTGTPVQEALNQHIAAGRPIGGTSAGLAVLTQFVYSALGSKGITSAQALADPYNRYNTFARDFLYVPQLQGAIGDTHFAARDRMGRTLSFLCRIHAAGWSAAPRAIAVSEETAVLIDDRGNGEVVGLNHAYFIGAPGAPEVCSPGLPLTYRNVAVRRVGAGETFNVGAWRGSAGTAYTVTAEAGVLSSTQAGGSAY